RGTWGRGPARTRRPAPPAPTGARPRHHRRACARRAGPPPAAPARSRPRPRPRTRPRPPRRSPPARRARRARRCGTPRGRRRGGPDIPCRCSPARPSLALQWHRDPALRPLAEGTAHGHGATPTPHAVTDGLRQAVPVLAHGPGVEATAAIADERAQDTAVALHVDVRSLDARLLGHVDQRPAAGTDDRR